MTEHARLLQHCDEVKAELLKERLRLERLERRVKTLRRKNQKLSDMVDILRDLLAEATSTT